MTDRLLNVITLGRITLTDDAGELQRVQVIRRAQGSGGADAITDDVPRAAEFGFTSVAPEDADAVLIHLAGRAGNGIVIATSHKPSRPRELKKGDTAIYDARGRTVRLTDAGIEIDAKGGEVLVSNASKVRCTCDVETTGDIVSRADGDRVSLNKLHDTFNLHNHPPVAGAGTWGSGPPKPQA